ncbi:MAG: hypothetical protein LQ348_004400 [Seirophora lacunosa]|nr:MAG: hypothetical protein LQ348_004400 [Seirophora lacunosa]
MESYTKGKDVRFAAFAPGINRLFHLFKAMLLIIIKFLVSYLHRQQTFTSRYFVVVLQSQSAMSNEMLKTSPWAEPGPDSKDADAEKSLITREQSHFIVIFRRHGNNLPFSYISHILNDTFDKNWQAPYIQAVYKRMLHDWLRKVPAPNPENPFFEFVDAFQDDRKQPDDELVSYVKDIVQLGNDVLAETCSEPADWQYDQGLELELEGELAPTMTTEEWRSEIMGSKLLHNTVTPVDRSWEALSQGPGIFLHYEQTLSGTELAQRRVRQTLQRARKQRDGVSAPPASPASSD